MPMIHAIIIIAVCPGTSQAIIHLVWMAIETMKIDDGDASYISLRSHAVYAILRHDDGVT